MTIGLLLALVVEDVLMRLLFVGDVTIGGCVVDVEVVFVEFDEFN